jgi:chemotaxis protein methyltransferase CheR
MVTDDEVEAGIEALVEDLRQRSGHDFRQYARGSRRRRIESLLTSERLADIAALRLRLRDDPAFIQRVLQALSIPATAMFRDPEVYRAIRERVVPHLATFPIVRVWLAGCATGEEAWSLAVLLHEAGIYPRCRLYATDMNNEALARAAAGIFPLSAMRDYTRNYQQAGGGRDFSSYYTAAYGAAKFDAGLGRNLVFAQHNLAVDRSFNEFHLILCRNVLIYFDDELQARVHQLLHDSLAHLGVLCLGATESLHANPPGNRYQPLDTTLRLYRKVSRDVEHDGDQP